MIFRAAWGGLALLCCACAATAAERIVSATYAGETDIYDHGILGDAVEFSKLTITHVGEGGQRITRSFDLSAGPYVFEDIAPRLWDVDGVPGAEVVVILTHLDRGAALAVYGVDGMIAKTPHIGHSHRWLVPVGAGDLDGDGRIEIAYIDRPHLAKVLRVVRLEGDRLVEVASLTGLANHKIGWDFIAGGLRDCDGDVVMITARGDWQAVMETRLRDGVLSTQAVGPYRHPQDLADALRC